MKFKKLISILTLGAVLLGSFYTPSSALALDTLPPIPVSDAAMRTKEVGITIFGYTVPGLTLDSVVIVASKIAIEKIVDSTVSWINSGFDGNPAYLKNPKQYFEGLADGIVGSFIQGSDLNLLCSPFKDLVKVSLVNTYYAEENQFQCTLTDVIGNIDNFYDDFSQGGWDAWFSMTQNPTNNPYGAYIQGKIELDSRLAEALGQEKDELSQGRGVLTYKRCAGQKLPPEYSGPEHNNGCLGEWETATPGVFIQDQAANVFGTGVRKLELADEFDEIVGALLQQLLEKSIMGIKGLIGAPKVSEGPGGGQRRIDIDGDGVADGHDLDGDGRIDLCYFGGVSSPLEPPCRGSKDTSVPPYIPPPGGGQCLVSGNKYEGVLASAMNAVLAENPDVAALDPRVNEPRNGREYRVNAIRFLQLTAEKLGSMGYRATEEVLNGSGRPSTGDIIAVWSAEDTEMERYDAIDGNATVMRDAPSTDFTGFIPLDCTLSGGGDDCGCKSNDDGGGTNPGPGPSNPGTPGGPRISAVSPNPVAPGATITITGTNLSTTVRFVDSTGGPNTIGNIAVNADKTQATVQVPAGLASGAATVQNIVYNNSGVVSNTFSITIGSASNGNITTATPTDVFTPTGIEYIGYLGRTYNNGWWPSLSPNGRYVAFGNWGGSYVIDLRSTSTPKQMWNFKNPGGLPQNGMCAGGKWMSNTKLTFICAEPRVGGVFGDGGAESIFRYEVIVGEWVPRRTNDNHSLIGTLIAKDNHWASTLAGSSRTGAPSQLVKDNQLIASGAGGAISLGGNSLVYACTNDNTSICVRTDSSTRTYPARTTLSDTKTDGSYIIYGGYSGGVHGITPNGSDVRLTLSPSGLEGPSDLVNVNGVRWVVSTAWGTSNGVEYTFILLRPWGSRSAIVVSAPAISASTIYNNGNFVISYNDDVGNMKVLTVPITAPRHQF